MRIITQVPSAHNAALFRPTRIRGFFLFLAVATVLIMAGCSRDSGRDTQLSGDTAGPPVTCNIVTDASGWEAFTKLADRISQGESISRQELNTFGDLPSVTVWRNSLQPNVPDSRRVGSWLEGTFWDDLGRTGPQKRNADRATFRRSYRYSLDNRDRIEQRVGQLTGPKKCDVLKIAEFWVEAGRLPDTLAIHFLPSQAEIRIFEGSLLVDTGVVSAGNVDQVIRQMAGLLYRKYQVLDGPSPLDLAGDQAVAQVFRVLMNEGIIGFIEQTLATEFDSHHPTLAKFKIIPEWYFIKTQEAVALMNGHLGAMLNDEETMSDRGQALVSTLGAMNAYSQAGYGMASVIAARLGEDRLRQVSGSVPAFVEAYQEAASLNPVPIPVPGTLGVELYQTVPPLEPEVHDKLQSLLRTVFPE